MASADKGMAAMHAAGRHLSVTTWNIAAINNNPFEYWITYKENPAYEDLMVQVERFLENPGDKDVPVSSVFNEDMFARLDAKMAAVGWKSVKSYWDDDFKNRKIVSEFMKVSSQWRAGIGSSQLADSMSSKVSSRRFVHRTKFLETNDWRPCPIASPTRSTKREILFPFAVRL